MRFAGIVDTATAGALDVAWLNEALAPVSEFGRRAFGQLAPLRPGEEAAAEQRASRIAQTARTIAPEHLDAIRDALRSSPDPLPAISRAAMGDVLEDAQLLELLRFLDAAKRVENALPDELPWKSDLALTPVLRRVAEALEPGRAGKFGFYLSETLDPDLARARERADRAQAEYDSARGRLAQRAAQALGRDELAGGEFIVMRDAAPAIPQGVRVIREAPTYFLCELELDETALEALNRRDTAAHDVAAAEDRARARISGVIRQGVTALETLVSRLGEFDVHVAQARFTQQYACVPARVSRTQRLTFRDASYLPLKSELESAGRAYEPISVDLSDVAVLTGPNMGGKSAALRTCGFVALLAAFGIPVPAAGAECALFEEIAWLGIGAQEDLGGLLSSFAREVVRLKEILARPASRMLVLIDEFARTTTPHEGKALLVALVRGLRRRERLAFIATHLGGIAAEARVRGFAVRGLRDVPQMPPGGDLNAALSALAKSMDYAVVEIRGDADRQADAIALAHLLGLDDDLVAEAGMLLHDESNPSWTR